MRASPSRARRGYWIGALLTVLATGALAQAAAPSAPAVADVLGRYAKARGGEQAWDAIHAMGWTGNIHTSTGAETDLPFLMLFQRPNASRFEVSGKRLRAIRVFDGTEGWKVRPAKETGLDSQPFTAQELAMQRDAGGLDGPLCHSQAKGIRITLEGQEGVEGHAAWRLRVTLPSGQVQHHWIDAANYQELRYDRPTYDVSGRKTTLMVYYREYQQIKGLTIPMVIETRDGSGAVIEQMTIEKIALNPDLAPDTFSGPGRHPRHGGVLLDTSKAAAAAPALR